MACERDSKTAVGEENGPNVIIGYDAGEIILMIPSFRRSISHFRVVSARTPSVSPVGRTTSTQGCDWYNEVVPEPYPHASVFQVKT
jgi:hypothetical protein